MDTVVADPVVAEDLVYAAATGGVLRPVLAGVSFRVAPGEIVMVTGPAGAGKSALLALLAGWRVPQGGRLQVLGTELVGASPRVRMHLRRRVGCVVEGRHLRPGLTVRDNVAMALRLAAPAPPPRVRTARAEAALGAVGLCDHADALPAQLSSGERQRVALARALALDPLLLLADAPTAGLDARAGRQLVEVVQTAARERGAAVVLATDDAGILDVADRVLSLERGTLLGLADPERTTIVYRRSA